MARKAAPKKAKSRKAKPKVPTLRFECTFCTDCCTKYIPLIVSEDVRRIMYHTGLPVEEFIRFYDEDRVDLPASDNTWIPTRFGKRSMGLRKLPGKGRCYFLNGSKCRIHEHKPLLCRMYPFKPLPPRKDPVNFIVGEKACNCEFTDRLPLGPLRELYTAYSDTHHSYVDEIKFWHRETRGKGTIKGFLRFLGIE